MNKMLHRPSTMYKGQECEIQPCVENVVKDLVIFKVILELKFVCMYVCMYTCNSDILPRAM